jgi:hypothetical protein
MPKKKIVTEDVIEDQDVVNADATIDDDTVIDESAAGETMHPNSKPGLDSKSKVAYLKALINGVNAMEVDGQAAFFKSMMKHLNDHGAAGAGSAESNKATIKTHAGKAVKEDFIAMFGEDDTLTEEFKEKASTLFEAAVELQVEARALEIEADFQEQLEEGISQTIEAITEQVDEYLNYAVEQFMEENQIAIETALRSDITEQFITGLKNLFTENYIEVPDDKLDVLDTLATRNDELEEQLDAQIKANSDLQKQLTEAARKDAYAETIADLSPVQVEKFKKLAEGVEFDGDVAAYTKKLTTVKEGFLAADSKKPARVATLEEQTGFEPETPEKKPVAIDETVSALAAMLSRTTVK